MTNLNSLRPFPAPLAALALATGICRVPDNCVVTVHRSGRFIRALGAGWHWTLPGLDQLGQPVCLIGHHLDIPAKAGTHAELYYQILDPAQAGAALDQVDSLVSEQARDALAALPERAEPGRPLADLLKTELNRRVGRMGLRVIRCSFHAA